MVKVEVPAPGAGIVLGEKVMLSPAGAPAALSVTLLLKAPETFVVSVPVAGGPPATTENELPEADNV
jgi:hypothetical protein